MPLIQQRLRLKIKLDYVMRIQKRQTGTNRNKLIPAYSAFSLSCSIQMIEWGSFALFFFAKQTDCIEFRCSLEYKSAESHFGNNWIQCIQKNSITLNIMFFWSRFVFESVCYWKNSVKSSIFFESKFLIAIQTMAAILSHQILPNVIWNHDFC